MQNLKNITEILDKSRQELTKLSRITEHYSELTVDELISFQERFEVVIKALTVANNEVSEKITAELSVMNDDLETQLKALEG